MYIEVIIPVNEFKYLVLLDNEDKTREITQTQFIKRRVAENEQEYSNGQTALDFFDKQLQEGHLYLLDEPENSLSPKFQLELITLISDLSRYFNCQFIIATHSPFMLSIPHAKIYDLDAYPVTDKRWTELENVKIYREFFKEHEREFEGEEIL